jgi:hypothetical protein
MRNYFGSRTTATKTKAAEKHIYVSGYPNWLTSSSGHSLHPVPASIKFQFFVQRTSGFFHEPEVKISVDQVIGEILKIGRTIHSSTSGLQNRWSPPLLECDWVAAQSAPLTAPVRKTGLVGGVGTGCDLVWAQGVLFACWDALVGSEC